MIKTYPRAIALILTVVCGSANAQFTQMIVDNNNRIMPIFFHDSANQAIQSNQRQNFQARQADSTDYLPPRQAPQRQAKRPNMQSHYQKPANMPRNPLTGPYYISPERHRIMAAAHSLLGTPYIYGGNNPAKGLDCSSLMQFIYKNALGVSLPRTAAQQRDRSKSVNYRDLQPGDMLFFKIDRRNNHVGIYIGEGKFIHASSSNRRASIASMNLPYWKKRFIKFGSYLGS